MACFFNGEPNLRILQGKIDINNEKSDEEEWNK
jgi:hypothetical protein